MQTAQHSQSTRTARRTTATTLLVAIGLIASITLTAGAAAAPPGAPETLAGPMPVGSEIEYTSVSPDGQWVVYIADAEDEGVFELWSAPIAGGSPIHRRSD